ncbi:Katanin p80 WD40 repeat-containing subunit B1-like [Vitis vinifera]|uniref:Katanin p80 WD40 repeat-containing subunit B1-like n=1 Tax=Vitis vinifera TaxID=29760 RepID=A0A438JHQ2_VITVI|nr:Katanin p80 WD40 repeat-containing subunit B1-like [Vitis vinifera]
MLWKGQPQISGRESTAASEENTIEDVVRHFWEQNDVKGAINALRKLPDHSVGASRCGQCSHGENGNSHIRSISCLLPVLMSLLDSNLERHANLSLDMLLKLVSVFGPVIHSAISAPPAIGVNLQAEHRRECCNQCFIQLQKIQKNLPVIIR